MSLIQNFRYLKKLDPRERQELLGIVNYQSSATTSQGALSPSTQKNILKASQKWTRTVNQENQDLTGELVDDLKANLSHETQVNKDLRKQLEAFARKEIRDREHFETEKIQLTEKLGKVNSTLTTMMQENVDLKKKAVYFERHSKELTTKLDRANMQLKNVRSYACHLNSDIEGLKHKDFRESLFWKNLMANHVIQDSEPPIDYPVPIDISQDKNPFLMRQEIERISLENKKQMDELKSLTKRLTETEKQRDEFKKQKNQLKSHSNSLISQLKQQLLGAVRRINYLIEEKKKVEQENDKRAKYTSKLELKIVKENLNNKGLRKHVRNLQEEIQDKNVTDALQGLGTGFQHQAALTQSTITSKSRQSSRRSSSTYHPKSKTVQQAMMPPIVSSPSVQTLSEVVDRNSNEQQADPDDMFSAMERQVQAYYQLQRNIENGDFGQNQQVPWEIEQEMNEDSESEGYTKHTTMAMGKDSTQNYYEIEEVASEEESFT